MVEAVKSHKRKRDEQMDAEMEGQPAAGEKRERKKIKAKRRMQQPE